MKLLIVVPRFPYPLDKGDKLRAYHQICELAKKHTIYLVCLSDEPISEKHLDKLRSHCVELHVYRLFKPLVYWNTALQWFTDKPFQVGYFYQRNIQRKINDLIQRIKPDHIYCQLIRTAEYLKLIQHIPKTIDYMDSLGKGMHRRAEISRGIRKYLLNLEGNRLVAYENRIFDYFEYHTIISEQDRKQIQHPANQTIQIVENGIGREFLDYQSQNSGTEYDLVFVGNLSYAPNVECALTLAEQILPALTQAGNPMTLLLSGTNPNSRIKQLPNEQIHLTGWVDDIRASYCNARMFVAPLYIGTGLQNKLLEAMALGIPSITTSLANNALGAVHGESILLANTTEEFTQAILKLAQNEDLRNQIGQAGKKFVSLKFNWETSTRKLESLFLNSGKTNNDPSVK